MIWCTFSYKLQSIIINWWKGKPSGSIACTRKQQPRFYWSIKHILKIWFMGLQVSFITRFGLIAAVHHITNTSHITQHDCYREVQRNQSVVSNHWYTDMQPYTSPRDLTGRLPTYIYAYINAQSYKRNKRICVPLETSKSGIIMTYCSSLMKWV